jgi:hypothetical protein
MVERRRSTGRPARTRRWPRRGRHCPRKVQPRAWATCLGGGRLWQRRGDAVVALYGTSAELGMERPRGSSAGGRASLGGIEEGVWQHGVHGGGMVPSPGSRRGKGKGEGEIGEGSELRASGRSLWMSSPDRRGHRRRTGATAHPRGVAGLWPVGHRAGLRLNQRPRFSD